jgi:hypothetical protein
MQHPRKSFLECTLSTAELCLVALRFFLAILSYFPHNFEVKKEPPVFTGEYSKRCFLPTSGTGGFQWYNPKETAYYAV